MKNQRLVCRKIRHKLETNRYFPIAERDRHWGLFITTLGESHFGPGVSFILPTGHPMWVTLSTSFKRQRLLNEFPDHLHLDLGGGWFQSSAMTPEKAIISAGNLILLFPGEWHNYGPSAMGGWR